MKRSRNIKQKLGAEGEKLALHYLRDLGLTILETNWRKEHYEVDLIATNDTDIIIIEVKTRSTAVFGHPESAVSKSKENNLANAAELYLEAKGLDLPVRYDIIAVILNEGKLEIEHFEDAFFPGAY